MEMGRVLAKYKRGIQARAVWAQKMFISTVTLSKDNTTILLLMSRPKTKLCPINVSCQKCKKGNFKMGKYKNTLQYIFFNIQKYIFVLYKNTKPKSLHFTIKACVSNTLPRPVKKNQNYKRYWHWIDQLDPVSAALFQSQVAIIFFMMMMMIDDNIKHNQIPSEMDIAPRYTL